MTSAPFVPSVPILFNRIGGAALAAVTGLSLVLASCSSDEDANPTGTAQDQSFQAVTFPSPWGESTVTQKPVRIASIGYKDADMLASLGEVPVLMGDSTLKQEIWTVDAFGDKSPESTFTYADSGSVDLEKVAESHPDLIVATQMDLKDQYAELSKIAPVIAAHTEEDVKGNWQQTVTDLGKSLGKEAEAASVIEQTSQTAAEVKEAHPEFAGKSISMLNYFGLEQTMYLNPQGSDAAALMQDIGFTLPDGTGELSGPISAERFDDTAADVMVIMDNSRGKIRDLLDNHTFAAIPAVAEGRILVIHNKAFETGESAYTVGDGEQQKGNLAWALGYPGPLSTQWALKTLAPLLSATVAGHGTV